MKLNPLKWKWPSFVKNKPVHVEGKSLDDLFEQLEQATLICLARASNDKQRRTLQVALEDFLVKTKNAEKLTEDKKIAYTKRIERLIEIVKL